MWLVGPHILQGGDPCKACESTPTESLAVHCAQGLYHNWLPSYKGDSKAVRVAFLVMFRLDLARLLSTDDWDAVQLNCGLEGEFGDFFPTLQALLDANMLTVVSNYWYESATANRTALDSTELVRPASPEWFFPEGNQNEVHIYIGTINCHRICGLCRCLATNSH